MKHNYPYMTDYKFLKELDLCLIKEQYVKITSLNFITEAPLHDIEGIVTSGSINIDGSSSLRRTGSMSITIQNSDYIDIMNPENIFSMNKKIDVQIGYKNLLDKYTEYDVIWIPQGIYVITGVSINHTENGIDVGLQIKDKMCLLNGDVSGTLPAAVLFNEIEDVVETAVESKESSIIQGNYETDKKTLTTEEKADMALIKEDDKNMSLVVDSGYILSYESEITNPPIYQIIQELVNHYGGEQLGNILIENIPDQIKSVIQYNGKKDLYAYYTTEGESSTRGITFTFKNPWENEESTIPPRLPNLTTSNSDGVFKKGDVIGFRYTDFTYPGELSGAAGESVTSVLDKIVNTLGNYEYFYDTDGIFHFREKRNFLNTTQATYLDRMIRESENANYNLISYSDKAVYQFDDNKLISNISVSPQYDKIKNDLIICFF